MELSCVVFFVLDVFLNQATTALRRLTSCVEPHKQSRERRGSLTRRSIIDQGPNGIRQLLIGRPGSIPPGWGSTFSVGELPTLIKIVSMEGDAWRSVKAGKNPLLSCFLTSAIPSKDQTDDATITSQGMQQCKTDSSQP